MLGVVAILLALFVIGPIGLFVVGAIWSAIGAQELSEDAFESAQQEPTSEPA